VQTYHAFSITQGNSPCVASRVRHGLAHRSVGSSRNGVSAPHVAAIDSRKPRMTKSSRQLTWICKPPPLPRKFILNVCCFGWGWGPCFKAIGPTEKNIRHAWHIAVLLSQKLSLCLCFDGLLFIILIYGLCNGAVSSWNYAASDCMMKTTEIWRRVVGHSYSQSVVRETVSPYEKVEVKMLYWIF
jgi:hypothetical protein